MENKIRINLDNNLELVAELYNHDGKHPEITVYIEKDGIIYQDICLVRPHEGKGCIQQNDSIDCLVWGDENNEDFTDEYCIGIYEEENTRYYDVVASICTETCRTDSHLICGGFNTEEEAMDYINTNNISEEDYYKYCRDDETVYIEIEERDDVSGNIVNVITVD